MKPLHLFIVTILTTPLALLATTPLPLLPIHQSGRRKIRSGLMVRNDILSNNRRTIKSKYCKDVVVNSLRGGSSDGLGNNNGDDNNQINNSMSATLPYQEQQQPPLQAPTPHETTRSTGVGGEFVDVMSSNNDPMYGYRETVEDRIDAWRKQQQHMQQTQSAADAAAAVDEQGRFKLFTTVSKVSVSFFFFILMWRTVHHYELADSTFGPSGKRTSGGGFRAALVRTIVLSPLVVLFLGEMIGAILGLSGGGGGQSHATKKRLKGILNLHKGVELVMMAYNIVRLAIFPSRYTIREVYIGRTISNFFFLLQCQLYTKLSWDDVSMKTAGDGYVYESYYDDYTPEMENEWQGNENTGHDASQQNYYEQYYPQQ